MTRRLQNDLACRRILVRSSSQAEAEDRVSRTYSSGVPTVDLQPVRAEH